MHPGYSTVYLGDLDQYIEHLQDRIKALGADRLYMVHNHPNGNPTPSDSDIWATTAIAMSIPQFKGHIIINSGKYGYINSTGSDATVKPLPNLSSAWIDPIIQPSVPHELLESNARTIEHIASWAKALIKDRDMPVLVYIDSDSKVRGLQEVHPQIFTNIQLMREKMPQKLVDFGSIGAVAVLPDKLTEEMLDAVRAYVSAHVLWDAVGFAGRLPYSFSAGEPDLNYFGGRLRDTMPAQTVR